MRKQRRYNRSLVLASLYDGDKTAPDIALETRYSRPTVDTILAELIAANLVEVAGNAESRGGRCAQLFSLSRARRTAIGIAVAVPKIAAVLIDASGKLLGEKEISIPLWCPADAFISHLETLVSELALSVPDWLSFSGIGIAVPGIVDTEKGISLFFSRLSTFYNTPIKAMLEEKLKLKVELSRYLGTAAIADLYTSPKSFINPVLYIELGEGIEMSLIDNGRPYRGAIGNEGGLGHTVVERNGRTCLCGNSGCLEAYASNRVLMDEATLRIRNGEQSLLSISRELTDSDFYAAVNNGDRLATDIAMTGMRYLSIGIANTVNLLNPGTVIISGAIAGAGEQFLSQFEKEIRTNSLKIHSEKMTIKFSFFNLADGAKGVALSRIHKELGLFDILNLKQKGATYGRF